MPIAINKYTTTMPHRLYFKWTWWSNEHKTRMTKHWDTERGPLHTCTKGKKPTSIQ
jgi:hypothetical protein